MLQNVLHAVKKKKNMQSLNNESIIYESGRDEKVIISVN